jgi:hypothetical protein
MASNTAQPIMAAASRMAMVTAAQARPLPDAAGPRMTSRPLMIAAGIPMTMTPRPSVPRMCPQQKPRLRATPPIGARE